MSATEELRRLLDERGVGYDTRDGKAVKNTYWNIGDLRFGYCEQIYEDGQHETDLFMYRGYGCTPERAIAATLGNSRAERTCKQEERGWGTEGDHARVWLTCGHDCMVPTVQDLPNYCPSCGCKVVGE